MQFKVRITLKEEYVGWVEATDEEEAESKALQLFRDGEGEFESAIDSLDVEVEECDEEG